MAQNLCVWLVVAAVAGGLMIGGVYEMISAPPGSGNFYSGAHKVSRLTGTAWYCDNTGCMQISPRP